MNKEQLKHQLELIEKKEEEEKREKELNNNYKRFQERESDLIIGKAHADIGVTKIDHSWYKDRFFTIGDAISIRGNCGTSYNAQAPITSATHTYFHNVWSEEQRRRFQDALNKVAVKEIQKIMSDLRCVLEIMGLQSELFFVNHIYPEKMKSKILSEIDKERKIVLDKYSDKQFKELDIRQLSHSRGILRKYLTENRPKLLRILEPEYDN